MNTLGDGINDKAVCLFGLVISSFLFISNVNAIVIGQAAFSGSEYIHTFEFSSGSFTSVGEQIAPNGVAVFSDTSLDFVGPADLFFDNIAGASLGNALRDLNQSASLTIDFIGFGYGNAYPPYVNWPGDGLNRVGGLLTAGGSPATEWVVTIYDTSLNVIESANFSQPAIEDAVFFGFESSIDIARITVDKISGSSAAYTLLDDFRYETVVPVPPALWLFGSGVLGLVGVARRRNAP